MTVSYTIEPSDIEWEMDWSGTKEDGSRHHPDKPEKELVFEQEPALALLLLNKVIFINDHWWEKEWPEKARKTTGLNVNCNDVFAWGCADAEEISASELEDLYRMWKENPRWGADLWCMKKRREMPQDAVADMMRAAGVDLDGFQKEHSLRVNFYSGVSMAIAKHKYDAYAQWAREVGNEVLPFDKHWWAGWDLFKRWNPNWEKEVGDPALKRIRQEFIENNDFGELV